MSHVPNWWEFLILVGAALRTWVLISTDRILDGPRNRLLYRITADGDIEERETLREFLDCPWCFGNWCLGGWWVAWLVFPHAVLLVGALFAMGWVVGVVGART